MRRPSLPSLPPPSLTLPPPSVSARARRPIGRDRSQTHACVGAGCVSSHVCVLACMCRMRSRRYHHYHCRRYRCRRPKCRHAHAARSKRADACMCVCVRSVNVPPFVCAMRPRGRWTFDLIWAALSLVSTIISDRVVCIHVRTQGKHSGVQCATRDREPERTLEHHWKNALATLVVPY